MFRTKMNFFDGAVLLLVAAIALFFLIYPRQVRHPSAAVVISTPESVTEYAIDEPRELVIHSNGVVLTVKIEGGEVFVAQSDCPDLVCVHTGRICKSGETIVCAPAGVRIFLRGGQGDVDFVAG